ncbi:MAG: hypothetical protein ACR2ND_07930 [Solirubrobacteraceae bacterium]
MSTWGLLADLPVSIDGYELEGLREQVSSDFERSSTQVRLYGGGASGVGEDVTYDTEDHVALQRAGARESLSGERTLSDFCELIDTLDLFPQAPVREVSRLYRRWAFHAAALDLALVQAGRSLHAVLSREPRAVTFVVSLRLGEPATSEPLRRRLDRYPGLRFKLDPTASWDDALIEELAGTGAVDSVDFKGMYEGTVVDNPADPDLYARVARAFPGAWIEDPKLTPETNAVLARDHGRITWDAPIHGISDIEALRSAPRMVNVKPSRLGGLRSLLDTYDYCAERGIGNYGGGQFELGVGREQIQYLASVFHPDTPNDIAPTGYNVPDPPPGLPLSPLEPAPSRVGFRWG